MQITAGSWNGDGYCDDGTWGLDLNCSEFNFDSGDCGSRSDDTIAEAKVLSKDNQFIQLKLNLVADLMVNVLLTMVLM